MQTLAYPKLEVADGLIPLEAVREDLERTVRCSVSSLCASLHTKGSESGPATYIAGFVRGHRFLGAFTYARQEQIFLKFLAT